MNDLVTIAIPTYNRADKFLKQVITAALDQTWKNIEVLIGDNASTDHTKDIVLSFEDNRIKYFQHSKNIGANSNFNTLLNKAKGKWFFLFHDDDMIDKDFIETCISVTKGKTNLGFIRTGVRAIDKNGKILKERPNKLLGQTREDFYRSWFFSKTGLYLCNTLFNTQHLKNIGGFKSLHNLLEDNYALVKLLEYCDHGEVEEIKASYRYTYEQRTFDVPVKAWCEDFRCLLDMIISQCNKNERNKIELQGLKFFGHLCLRRANANQSLIQRFLAKIIIVRYFNLKILLKKIKRIN